MDIHIKKKLIKIPEVISREYDQPAASKLRIIDGGFFVAVVAAIAMGMFFSNLKTNDFELFWKSAADLWNGDNPYVSSTRVLSLNSPIGLGLLSFLGAIPYELAKQLYLFTAFFTLFWSIWIGYNRFWIPLNNAVVNLSLLVLAIPIGIFFQAIISGSLIIFPLLGISVFYCLDVRKHPFLAGCCLSLCLIKPHLFVLVMAWIFWWALKQCKILLPAGFISIALLAAIIALLLRADVFQAYLSISSNWMFTVSNASTGNFLYKISRSINAGILFIPLILGVFVLISLKSELESIDLHRACAILLPWSIFLSPYCWGHDYLACFALSFIAAPLIIESNKRKKHMLATFLGIGVVCAFTLGLILSFSLNSVNFLAYGVLFVSISGLTFLAEYRLRPDIQRGIH